MPKKLNRDEKIARQVADLARFVRQYARPKQKRQEPNDRDYDRKQEAAIKKLAPEDLDRLLRDDEVD